MRFIDRVDRGRLSICNGKSLPPIVLSMAAYTFKRDEHVRIDIFHAHRLGERGLAWLDLFGIARGSAIVPLGFGCFIARILRFLAA